MGIIWSSSDSVAPCPRALPDSILTKVSNETWVASGSSYNQLNGDRGHQTTEHDDTDCFNAGPSHRVLVNTGSSCHATRDQHDTRRHEVHESICCSRKQGQRPRGDGCIHLNDKQTEVNNERSVHSELDFGAIL
jgi:hypothetical protein